MVRILPDITGRSEKFSAFTISLPKPFQLKIYSTKTAPANKEANHPESVVTTGFKEFFNACLLIICVLDSPLDFAVLT